MKNVYTRRDSPKAVLGWGVSPARSLEDVERPQVQVLQAWLWSQTPWAQRLVPPLMRCVTLRKLLFWAPASLSVRDSISPYVIGIK